MAGNDTVDSDGLLEAVKADLKRDEGFVSHAYWDSEGVVTIGFGRMIDERLSGGISEEEAETLLANDICTALRELDTRMPWWKNLPIPARRGLLNMAFNLGLPRLIKFRRMLRALQAGDWENARKEALDSRWAKQVGKRAERIADMYLECADEQEK